ncbi:MAG: hypothetical protein K2Q18_13625 [Bdellovibrionales bacterium]|nr:hypothetical protein [Bdellovibrionales bacterium]
MKNSLQILLFLVCISTNLKAETSHPSSFSKDSLIIKKVARELLGSNIKYDLIFNKSDDAHAIPKGTNSFEIVIGQKSYDEYGLGEGPLALACHELGHVAARTKEWISSEEGADYWATKVCMPKMLKYFPNKKNVDSTPFDNEFKLACEKNPNKEDQEICYRSLRGAYFFRENTHRDLCNTQKLYLKTTTEELSRTPYKGKRPPNMSQCSFNNLVAGALKLKQPTCYNLIMDGFSFFGPNCSPGSLTSMPQLLGVEDDDLLSDQNSISDLSRSAPIIKNDEATSQGVISNTSSK